MQAVTRHSPRPLRFPRAKLLATPGRECVAGMRRCVSNRHSAAPRNDDGADNVSRFRCCAKALEHASHPAQFAAELKSPLWNNRGRGKQMSYSEDLHNAALAYHRFPRPGKLEIQATKPLANQRDLALAYSPGVAAACTESPTIRPKPRRLHHPRQSRRRRLQRHRRARPRQYRPARLQAGDGRQGGAVQEIRRHRRVRHRDRRRHHRRWSTSSRRWSRPSAASISRTSRPRNVSRSRRACRSA